MSPSDKSQFGKSGPQAPQRQELLFGGKAGPFEGSFRTVPDPMMDLLDCPDSSQLSPKRSESSTPLQALALLNHPFLLRMSEHLAERVQREGSLATLLLAAVGLAAAYRYWIVRSGRPTFATSLAQERRR